MILVTRYFFRRCAVMCIDDRNGREKAAYAICEFVDNRFPARINRSSFYWAALKIRFAPPFFRPPLFSPPT